MADDFPKTLSKTARLPKNLPRFRPLFLTEHAEVVQASWGSNHLILWALTLFALSYTARFKTTNIKKKLYEMKFSLQKLYYGSQGHSDS